MAVRRHRQGGLKEWGLGPRVPVVYRARLAASVAFARVDTWETCVRRTVPVLP